MLGPLYTQILTNTNLKYALNPYLSNIIMDSIDDTNYSKRPENTDAFGNQYFECIEPDGSANHVDIIPALQFTAVDFNLLNLFDIDISVITKSIVNSIPIDIITSPLDPD